MRRAVYRRNTQIVVVTSTGLAGRQLEPSRTGVGTDRKVWRSVTALYAHEINLVLIGSPGVNGFEIYRRCRTYGSSVTRSVRNQEDGMCLLIHLGAAKVSFRIPI